MHFVKKVGTSFFFNSIFVFLGLCSLEQVTGEPNGPVQVFILAGQSNMEGKGFPRPLSWQLGQAKYRERYLRFVKDEDDEAFLKTLHSSLAENSRQPQYAWAERKDVWVDFHEQHGNLKVGYSPNRDCCAKQHKKTAPHIIRARRFCTFLRVFGDMSSLKQQL